MEEVSEFIRKNGEPPEMTPEAYVLIHKLVVEANTALRMDRLFTNVESA